MVRVGDGVIRLHHVPVTKAAAGVGAYLRSYGGSARPRSMRVTALDRRRRFDLVEVHNMPDFLTFSAIGPRLRGVPVILNCTTRSRSCSRPASAAPKVTPPYAYCGGGAAERGPRRRRDHRHGGGSRSPLRKGRRWRAADRGHEHAR